MQYRRVFRPGGTYFFTAVTFNRKHIFIDEGSVELLRQAFRYTMVNHPFSIYAAIIMPDHIHMVWTLPADSDDYPTRWRLIKSYFSKNYQPTTSDPVTDSRMLKGEKTIWQRRYWEHLIRDEEDLQRHVDYIHYNPVKHGLAKSPAVWKYSSIHSFIQSGIYPVDWGVNDPKGDISGGEW